MDGSFNSILFCIIHMKELEYKILMICVYNPLISWIMQEKIIDSHNLLGIVLDVVKVCAIHFYAEMLLIITIAKGIMEIRIIEYL